MKKIFKAIGRAFAPKTLLHGLYMAALTSASDVVYHGMNATDGFNLPPAKQLGGAAIAGMIMYLFKVATAGSGSPQTLNDKANIKP